MNSRNLFKAFSLALSLSLATMTVSLPAAPASAAPARNIAAAGLLQQDLAQNVQWRRHGYHRWHRRHHGGAVAAGVIGGLALGAILGAAAASAPPPPPVYYGPAYADGDWLAYCASKYRSFDPRTGTYLGYDGLRHPCR